MSIWNRQHALQESMNLPDGVGPQVDVQSVRQSMSNVTLRGVMLGFSIDQLHVFSPPSARLL